MAERYITPIFLIKNTEEESSDELGNPIKEISKKKVLCAKVNITSQEFFQAKTLGYKKVVAIKVRRFEYSDEEKVEFEKEIFKVLKVDDYDEQSIKLTLYKGVHDGTT